MAFTLRPCIIPDDSVRLAEINSAVNPEPVTGEQVAEQHRHMPPNTVICPVMAVGEAQYPVGFGVTRHFAHDAPGRFTIRTSTDPRFRRQGAGGLMYEHVEGFAREHGATILSTMVRDNDPASLAFAEKRGYTVDRHTFESILDLTQFDEARFAGAIEAVEATGIRFFSLAEDPSEANLRRYYDMVWSLSTDVPGFTLTSPPPYETWAEQALKGPRVRQDLLLGAADGDRWVGFVKNDVSPVNGSAYNGGTAVDRAYRGRGIALALKLLAIRRARATGVPYMRTNNDSTNAPMLAVNRKLGYQPAPGTYDLIKQL